jgi:hypothetical protein
LKINIYDSGSKTGRIALKKQKKKRWDSCVFFTDHRALRTRKDLGMKMAMKRN